MADYYTLKKDVPLLPGQTLGFTAGRGYYAAGTPTPSQTTKNTTAAPPSVDRPVATPTQTQPVPANAAQVAKETTAAPTSVEQPVAKVADVQPVAANAAQVVRNQDPPSFDQPVTPKPVQKQPVPANAAQIARNQDPPSFDQPAGSKLVQRQPVAVNASQVVNNTTGYLHPPQPTTDGAPIPQADSLRTLQRTSVPPLTELRKEIEPVEPASPPPKQLPGKLSISNMGIREIQSFEAFVPQPYDDGYGNVTIGYGHVIRKGHVTAADREKWGTISQAEAAKLLRSDLQIYEAAVRAQVKVPITQTQFDALVSFTFNVGVAGLEESDALKDLNHRRYNLVPSDLLHFVHDDNGDVVPGLVARRKKEGATFARGTYVASTPGSGAPPPGV